MKFWQGGIFGQVKSVVKKIAFSKGGVTLQFAPMDRGIFGQIKSVVEKIAFSKGGVA